MAISFSAFHASGLEVAMKAYGWKTLAWRGGAVAAALAGTVITGTEASAQALRTEGASTFVASRDEVRVPTPPDRFATETDIAELKRLTAERSATSAARAAYWATGGSAYRWNAVAGDEMISRGIPTPVAARHMAPRSCRRARCRGHRVRTEVGSQPGTPDRSGQGAHDLAPDAVKPLLSVRARSR